jgi:hypothetical protein
VNKKLERIWKEEAVSNLRYYLGIFLERLRETTRNLSKNSRSLIRDLNQGPSKYDTGVITIRLQRSVITL